MVKVKMLSRSRETHSRETSASIDPVYANPDPSIHPFDRNREYVRALNAVKRDKLMAKPFLAALSGHADGVYAIRRHPKDIKFLASGSGDGDVRVWHLPTKSVRWRIPRAHHGMVRSVVYGREDRLLSVGTDRLVKCWDPSAAYQSLGSKGELYGTESSGFIAAAASATQFDDREQAHQQPPMMTWNSEMAFSALDHQRGYKEGLGSKFGTGAGSTVALWSYNRSEPVQTWEWGTGTVTSLSFNHIQTDVLAGTTTDRDVIFYDVRKGAAVHKVTLAMRSNVVAWNPMEAFNFTVANEDHNCYTFDMRKLRTALTIHQDHVGAVLSIDFSPTGAEFVTGSYDKTVRVFNTGAKNSRDSFHTRRMQRIFGVQFSGDARYVFSASDDTNIRIWKSIPSAPIGVMLPREREHLAYAEKLKERYKHVPELRQISRHRHVPKPVLRKQKLKKIMKEAQFKKDEHMVQHNPKQKKLLKSAKKLVVIGEAS